VHNGTLRYRSMRDHQDALRQRLSEGGRGGCRKGKGRPGAGSGSENGGSVNLDPAYPAYRHADPIVATREVRFAPERARSFAVVRPRR
jgi:hypothetical protein